MTVGELRKALEKFDENLEVLDIEYIGINYVEKEILTDEEHNHPYKKPDKEVVVIY